MKANELMIGDWVECTYWFPSKQLKVAEIRRIVDDEIKVGVYSDDLILIFRQSEVKPIPLTPEILEKNGFEKTQIHGEKQDDIFQCFDGEIIIEVGIYDPNFILIHYRYETSDGINSGELSSIVKVDGGKFYLHELQHALRLCGITREIIVKL